jgi:hypothetical protein
MFGQTRGVMDQNIANRYRARAEECRAQAERAVHSHDKAAWLKMAEDWQRLAESVEAGELKSRQKLPGVGDEHERG